MVQFLQKGLQRHLDDVSKLYVPWGWWAGQGRAHAAGYPRGVWSGGQSTLVSEMHVVLTAEGTKSICPGGEDPLGVADT